MPLDEFRCPNDIKFGELTEEFVEFKCRSKRCGAQPGVVVIHRFSHTGQLLRTMKFRDPAFQKEVKNGCSGHESSLRSA